MAFYDEAWRRILNKHTLIARKLEELHHEAEEQNREIERLKADVELLKEA